MSEFMKHPCKNCPYRRDVRPFLTGDRGHELACYAQNPYTSFECHETTEHYDSGPFVGEAYATEKSKICAGMLTLRAQELGECGYEDEGFKPAWDLIYQDYWEMTEAYDTYGTDGELRDEWVPGAAA